MSRAYAAQSIACVNGKSNLVKCCELLDGVPAACEQCFIRYAVYVVSGLSETENLSIAQAIEPLVSRHITDAERLA
jgi:hypothetical protein